MACLRNHACLSRRTGNPKRLKAEAYQYADGIGPIPQELIALSFVDRFGAANVYGRPLGYGELHRMAYAENLVKAFQARKRATDWVAWTRDNPDGATMLDEAMRIAKTYGND